MGNANNQKILTEPMSEKERAKLPKEVIVELEVPFIDDRGAIQPLVDKDMKSCVLITSKKGSVRANHYHRTDWHYCYVLEGKIEYYERSTGSSDEPKKTLIDKGQMFFTAPMIDHTMVFLEDTTFLTFGRNSRSQEIYESDIKRIDPLNE